MAQEQTQTYWNSCGKHQQLSESLYKTLVPMSGSCETIEGELIRASSRIYYDYYNNGMLNNTSGAVRFLQQNLPNQSVDINAALRQIYEVCNTGGYIQNAVIIDELEMIVDAVVEYVDSKQGNYTAFSGDMFDLSEPDPDIDDCDDDDYWILEDDDDYDDNM